MLPSVKDDTLEPLRERLRQQPEDAETRLGLINHLVSHHGKIGDEKIIAEAMDVIAPLHPMLDALPELYLVKATLEKAAGKWLQLQETLEHMLRRRPDDANLLRSLSDAYIAQQKWSEVLSVIKRYRECLPDDPNGMDLLIATLLELGREDEAVRTADAVLRQRPGMDFRRKTGFLQQQGQARSKGLPAILINTQYKSGTNFISDGLCKGLDMPFCWITLFNLGHRIVPRQLEVLARGGAVCQQHLPPDRDFVGEISDGGIDRFITHVRDPRQSMLSAVHYESKEYQRSDFVGAQTRARLPDNYGEWSLSERIDHYIGDAFVWWANWTGTWLTIAAAPPNGVTIRLSTFEAMKADNRGYFEQTLEFYGVSEAHFDWSLVNFDPKPGDLHFRKGATDEWKSALTPQQRHDCEQIMRQAKVDLYL
ncbi:MAG: hypothetical protein QF512_12140 [Alphaproteobacteria bacterium]|nr:hypothetical protein [Alphaproteobacteria bacterium]